MKKQQKVITIEPDDSFKVIFSKFGALALDRQENLSELVGEETGDLDIEKGTIAFGDIELPVQILGFFQEDVNQWAWAWDNEDIFGKDLIKSSCEIKAIGDEFDIVEFSSPIVGTDFNGCHTLAMTASSLLDADAYYAVSEDGIDIFVTINSDLIEENNSTEKFKDTYYTFQKNFNVYPKIAFEAYTYLKGYIYKPHDDFSVVKIGEDRVIIGFTERGNVSTVQMLLGD